MITTLPQLYAIVTTSHIISHTSKEITDLTAKVLRDTNTTELTPAAIERLTRAGFTISKK